MNRKRQGDPTTCRAAVPRRAVPWWLVPTSLAAMLVAAACTSSAVLPTSTASATAPPPSTVDRPPPNVDSPTPNGARPAPISEEQMREELSRAAFYAFEWPKTNFRIRTIPLSKFTGGGPGKDDIPPIDEPQFETVAQADQWLQDREAVEVVEIGGDARAYPQQILIWHELVNDTVGGEPVTVTY